MPVTVEQLARASLRAILVSPSEATFEADELEDYIFALNQFMAALEADGICLGFTVVDSVNDEVTVPPGAIRGLAANMAIEVAPDYHAEVSEALVRTAEAGMRTMERLAVRISAASFPATLPIGSGNHANAIGPMFVEADPEYVFWCSMANASTSVTVVGPSSREYPLPLEVGMAVRGYGVPDDTVVSAVDVGGNPDAVTLSAACTETSANQRLTFGGLSWQ